MVHYFYRPFHLTFLGYGSWFHCFGFNSESRVSIFSLSPPSILEDGGLRLLGMTLSSTLEIHLTVTGFFYSNFMSVGHLVSQSIFCPLASFVPKALPNQAVFLVLGLPSQDHFS